jgi:ssDNA-binding Zn-finger/Zn-ribbon topoisomerase 1
VQESLVGLRNHGNEKSAEEGKVCPVCGKVHSSVPVGGTNHVAASVVSETSPQGQPCPVCGQIHSAAPAAGQTNMAAAGIASSAGSSSQIAGKYFYCPQCKVYHRSKPSPPVAPLPLERGVVSPPIDPLTNAGNAGRR